MKEVNISIPSSIKFVGPVIKFFNMLFLDKGLETTAVSNVVSAVLEALGNAIVHGNHSDRSKKITISVQMNQNTVQIEVRDEGTGFDIDSLPNPLTPENLLRPCGRGIFLIKTFMDNVSLDSNGKGSKLVMQKAFNRNIE